MANTKNQKKENNEIYIKKREINYSLFVSLFTLAVTGALGFFQHHKNLELEKTKIESNSEELNYQKKISAYKNDKIKLQEYEYAYSSAENIKKIIQNHETLINDEHKKYIKNWLLKNENNHDIFPYLSNEEKIKIYKYSNNKFMEKKYTEVKISKLLQDANKEKDKINQEKLLIGYLNTINDYKSINNQQSSQVETALIAYRKPLYENLNINEVINYNEDTKIIFEENKNLKELLEAILKDNN